MAAIRNKCCHEKGICFMERYHPKFDDFDEDLPGTCEYTDVDAFVECKRNYLFTEFKTEIGDEQLRHWETGKRKKKSGQLMALERLSMDLPKSTIWLVEGDAPNRQCTRMRECVDGEWTDWMYLGWAELKRMHADWMPRIMRAERARLDAWRASRDNGYRG